MINQNKFFDGYKKYFGGYNNSQYEGMLYLLDRFSNSNLYDRVSKIANDFAMIRTETAYSFQPVREGFYMKLPYMATVKILYNYYAKNNRGALRTIFPYGIDEVNYIGRGFPQTTHIYNYEKHQKHILLKYGVDIVKEPEKVLNKDIAFDIMEMGCNVREYSFTGKILSDYFNDKTSNWDLEKRFIGYKNMFGKIITPRQIINGTNKYREIGKDAIKFYNIIEFE